MTTPPIAPELGHKTMQIYLLAAELANRTPQFHTKKGPGIGDHATAAYMKNLRALVCNAVGQNFSETPVCKDTKHKFDFYIPEEATVVEIALSLSNPLSEYEKDVFKCLLAQEAGAHISTLLFLSKPGATKRLESSGAKAIAELVKRHFGLHVDVLELMPNFSPLDELSKLRTSLLEH